MVAGGERLRRSVLSPLRWQRPLGAGRDTACPGGQQMAACPQIRVSSVPFLIEAGGAGECSALRCGLAAWTSPLAAGIQRIRVWDEEGHCWFNLTCQKLNANLLENVCLLLGFSPGNRNVSQVFPDVLRYRFTDDERKPILWERNSEFDTDTYLRNSVPLLIASPCSPRQDPLLPATVAVPLYPVFISQKG